MLRKFSSLDWVIRIVSNEISFKARSVGDAFLRFFDVGPFFNIFVEFIATLLLFMF